MRGREDVVELREGVHAFNLRFVIREGKGAYHFFVEEVLSGLCEEKSVLDQWPAESGTRRLIAKAPNMFAADTDIRKRIVQGKPPFVTTALGLYCNHPGRKAAVLRQKRSLQNIDRFDAVHRHGRAETSGGRIRDIRGIHKKRALLLALTTDQD